MGKRAGQGNAVGGLHRRETASGIEQKFAGGDKPRRTRQTRPRVSSVRPPEFEPAEASEMDSAARENFTPTLVTFVAQMIRRGLEAGELQIIDGVVYAAEDAAAELR